MLIDVVAPVYKVEKQLNRCVDSILSQTCTEFELILVDDGSPDSCGAISDLYAEKDSRVRVIHKPNGGLSDARNAGIELAVKNSTSEWITFIDSDDWVHPRYLEAMFNAVSRTGCDICIGGYRETAGATPKTDYCSFDAEITDTEKFFCEHNANAVVAWGKLYRKELFRELRYPVGKLHEDEFTTYLALFKYPQISVISDPLYFYYFNPESIMQSKWSPRRLDMMEAFKQNILYFQKTKFHRACIKSVEKYEWGIKTQLRALEKSDEYNKDDYLPLFSKYCRFLLKSGKKEKMYPFSKYINYYQIAYPKATKYYWILRGIFSKFSRR